MWHHMGRYCKLSQAPVRDPWGEIWLKCSFKEAGVPIEFEDGLRTHHGDGFDDQLKHCGTLVPDLPALTRSG